VYPLSKVQSCAGLPQAHKTPKTGVRAVSGKNSLLTEAVHCSLVTKKNRAHKRKERNTNIKTAKKNGGITEMEGGGHSGQAQTFQSSSITDFWRLKKKTERYFQNTMGKTPVPFPVLHPRGADYSD
jgi:hypothetical protein